ncbi:MAG: alpha-glucosidase/alpha-galactosidase [Candidatus Methanomethylicia archaeon]
MDKIKIAIIGAGSAVWSSRIIIDLLLTEDLSKSKLILMDINEERLNLIYDFSRRYISELKVQYCVEKTVDRREAIRDADFIINSAMAGGHFYYEKMREISEEHGYYRGINSVEWNMVSDYHTIWGYYQFKLAMNIARDIEELAPNAWLIQIANPVFELTTLISRETKVKVIGLCHGHLGYIELAEALELNKELVEAEVIGFNHVVWLTKFKYNNEDAYHLIDEWIKSKAEKYWNKWRVSQVNPFDIQMSPAAIDMYKTYGLFPIGDTVRGGTWKYHWNLKTKQYWYGPLGGPDSEIGWMMYITGLTKRMNELSKIVYSQKPITSLIPPIKSGESVIPIIDSIVNDKRNVYQVNVLNQSSIPSIPDNVAVEMPVIIDGKGIHKMKFNPLPKKIMNYVIQPRMMRMEWALEAYLEGGRDALFQWLIVDPRTKNTKQVEETIDAILSIPENIEMAKYFK